MLMADILRQLFLFFALPKIHNCYCIHTLEKVVMEKPTLLTLMKLTTRIGAVIKVIENSANHYKLIGTILLDDRYGERVETIENDLRGKGEAIIREIYKKWMKEDTNCSWLTLTECFRDCNLHRLASDIEEHFGFPSPSPKGGYMKVKIP